VVQKVRPINKVNLNKATKKANVALSISNFMRIRLKTIITIDIKYSKAYFLASEFIGLW